MGVPIMNVICFFLFISSFMNLPSASTNLGSNKSDMEHSLQKRSPQNRFFYGRRPPPPPPQRRGRGRGRGFGRPRRPFRNNIGTLALAGGAGLLGGFLGA